jgi:hypothetical protein
MIELALFSKQADVLAQMWHTRALRAAKGRAAAVLIAALVAEIPGAVPVLLRVAFPGFKDVKLPQLTGYATIAGSGRVICDIIDRNRVRCSGEVIYESVEELRDDFRRLADKLKLNDAERKEMSQLLSKWVSSDLRYDHQNRKVLN